MTDGLFDDPWAKWAWAMSHARTLEDEINDLADNPQPLIFGVGQYDSKRHGFRLVALTVDPLPLRWSLILGDIVHGYRSCLDHLAWALVQRGHTPNLSEKKAKLVYFPVATERTVFNKQIVSMLPGVRRADI